MNFKLSIIKYLIITLLSYYFGILLIKFYAINISYYAQEIFFGLFEKDNSYKLTILALPFLGIFITTLSILIEIFCVGYSKSSLRKILSNSPSTNTDIMYMFFRLSGATATLAMFFSLGTLNSFANFFSISNIKLLNSDTNLFLQILSLLLMQSISFYIYHRIMHTKYFWNLHKVHHSATSYNVLLPYRNHFLDYLLASYVFGIFGLLAGGSNLAIILASGTNALYQSLVHSNITIKNRFINLLVITPDLHKIHHSCLPEHRDKNFGTLAFWDILFGTYLNTSDRPFRYGLGSRNETQKFQLHKFRVFNFLKLQFFIARIWLRQALKE